MEDKIFENIEKIRFWIAHCPDPRKFYDNNDFMNIYTQIMNFTLYLIRVSIALSKDEESNARGLTKNNAIIYGLIVRIAKLYDGFTKHIADHELELALIFSRLIFETEVKIDYLLNSKNKRKSLQSYIVGSYKPEKEILLDLNNKSKIRELCPLEKRIKMKIVNRLKHDGLTQKKILNYSRWDIDGKNFKQLLKDLDRESQYSYLFGSLSHHVHGDWYEIDLYHIKKVNGRYFPNLTYSISDPRLVGPISMLVLDRLVIFVKFTKNDSKTKKFMIDIITSLLALLCTYEELHEEFLSA